MAESPWGFFDDIVCINLKHRKDRYIWAKNVFAKLEIPARFVFVEKSPYGGVHGCFESHLNIIKESYAKGLNNILIFEDDILPTPSYSLDNIRNGIHFMKTHPTWDIFYYGYFAVNDYSDFIVKANSTDNKHVIRYSPTATHAYCLNRRSMKKILDTYKPYLGKEHLDVYFSSRELQMENYCYVPMLFEQTECVSLDNPARDEREHAVRSMGCVLENVRFHYNLSLVTFVYQHHLTITTTVFILAVFAFVIYILSKSKNKK